MRRRWAVGLVLASLAGLVTACGGGADGEARLRFVWWGNQDRAKVTEQVVELFRKENPKIRIETTFLAFQTYWEKLATETAGGNPPDIMQLDYRYLNEYAGRGVLLDLGPYLGKGLKVDSWNPGFVASGKIKDRQVALPLAQNTTTIVYDPKAFQAAGLGEPALGWTWSDYLAQATRISAGGQLAGATDFAGTEDVFEIWLRQRGKNLYTAEGKFGFEPGDLRGFWELAGEFRRAKAFNPAELTSGLNQGPEQTPLGRRRTASEHSYDSIFGGYHAVRPGELKLAPYPSQDKANLGQYRKPSQLITVSARTKAKDAAVKFVDFLLNNAEAGRILGANRGLPPNPKIRELVAKDLKGVDKAIYDYEAALDPVLGSAPPAPPKGDGAVYKLMQRLNEEIVFGRLTLDAAITQFFTESAQHLT